MLALTPTLCSSSQSALWLMGAKPLGIKLHEPLCLALGEAVLYCVDVCAAVGEALVPATRPALLVLARAGVLGASLQVRVACTLRGMWVAEPLTRVFNCCPRPRCLQMRWRC
jgi:hypothetical protein